MLRELKVGDVGGLQPSRMWDRNTGAMVPAMDVDDETGQLYAAGSPIGSQARHLMKTLQPADLLSLKASPVVVVPAPGVGYAPLPTEIVLEYQFVSVPYGNAGASDVDFYWHGAGGASAIMTFSSNNFLDQSQSQVTIASIDIPFVPRSQVENQELMLAHVGGASEFINGDGRLVAHVYYRVVQLAGTN